MTVHHPTGDARPERFVLDPALREACIESIKAGSKSFHAASLLLPGRYRLAARALYAFCRASDDLVDEATSGRKGAAELAARLDTVYSVSSRARDHAPVEDRVFAKVVAAFGIPRSVPDALIEGFAWDEAERSYDTLDELIAYAARVASTVGVMMTLIMGVRDHAALSRAADLGIAMQLTNIARDVGEDARRSRLYLPRTWLSEVGLDPVAWLANPQHDPALGKVVARLLAVADTFYERALTGVSGLPLDCRPAIRSAALIYREIGREIAKAGHDSVSRRAHTSANRKIELIIMAAAQPFALSPVLTAPTHPEARFLVDACADLSRRAPRGIDEKAGRLIEILGLAHARRNGLTPAE
jgi:15-cis-phytoene synthase